MIRHLTGTVADITEGRIVIDVSGIGYAVYVHASSDYFTLESTVTIHTYLSVQERALDLYGFITRDELSLFILLLTLPKIGPKSALQIMQKADTALLQTSVINNDAVGLSKLSGIGKKTAEKIVLGLQDRFDEFVPLSGTHAQSSHFASYTTDAIDALITLGYPQADARNVIHNLPETITDTNTAIKAALKELGKQ